MLFFCLTRCEPYDGPEKLTKAIPKECTDFRLSTRNIYEKNGLVTGSRTPAHTHEPSIAAVRKLHEDHPNYVFELPALVCLLGVLPIPSSMLACRGRSILCLVAQNRQRFCCVEITTTHRRSQANTEDKQQNSITTALRRGPSGTPLHINDRVYIILYSFVCLSCIFKTLNERGNVSGRYLFIVQS